MKYWRFMLYLSTALIIGVLYYFANCHIYMSPSLTKAMILNGYDLNSNQRIEASELKNMTTLALNTCNIDHISGISEKYSPKLKSIIFIQVNGISNYDFSTNSQISDLVLNICGISTLDQITASTNIKTLSLAGNNLISINGIQKYPNLECLVIDHNNIEDISQIENLVHLKRLDIRGNPINDFTIFQKSGELRTIYMDKNQFSKMEKQNPSKNIEFIVSE